MHRRRVLLLTAALGSLAAGAPALLAGDGDRGGERAAAAAPVRVFHIAGYPGWEYRYVKNVLVRERSLRTRCLLLSADPAFVQEASPGCKPAAAADAARLDRRAHDVIVLGDLAAADLERVDLAGIARAVQAGAGLIVQLGEQAAEHGYRDTPLAEVLPAAVAETGARHVEKNARRIEVAAAATDHPALAKLARDATLPGTWFHAHAWARPGASTLARFERELAPALIIARHGKGRVALIAFDETWRWRTDRGDAVLAPFWNELVRDVAPKRF